MNDDEARLAGLREMIPASGAGIYLDTATRGPLPMETAAAMRQSEDWELAVGRAWAGREDDVAQREAEARAVVAALIGADPDAVALTHGPEDGIELAREVLGGAVTVVDHVDPQTGTLLAAARLRHEARGGRAVVLDASLSAGAVRIDVASLGVEAVVLAGDRWLLGPEATGAVWLARALPAVRQRALARTSLTGLARSVGWLAMYVGLEWTFERTASLARRLHRALGGCAGVELLSPDDALATIVTFRLGHWAADEAADELRRRVHAIVRPLPEAGAVRASVAWFNTEDELDRFAGAVAELGRHTPDSLPRRPPIVVLGDG